MALTGSYDLIPDRPSALGPRPSTGVTGGASRGFEPRQGLQEYEVQGELQQVNQIQRLGRRAYRDALRNKDPMAGLKAIQGMRELGVRPATGIEPYGAKEAGIRQRGQWVHGQMDAQGNARPQPIAAGQEGYSAPLGNANQGTRAAPTTVPNAPANHEASDATLKAANTATGPLAERLGLFGQMQRMQEEGKDPAEMRKMAVESGVVDDRGFDLGLSKLTGRPAPGPLLQSRLPEDQTARAQAEYEAANGTPASQLQGMRDSQFYFQQPATMQPVSSAGPSLLERAQSLQGASQILQNRNNSFADLTSGLAPQVAAADASLAPSGPYPLSGLPMNSGVPFAEDARQIGVLAQTGQPSLQSNFVQDPGSRLGSLRDSTQGIETQTTPLSAPTALMVPPLTRPPAPPAATPVLTTQAASAQRSFAEDESRVAAHRNRAREDYMKVWNAEPDVLPPEFADSALNKAIKSAKVFLKGNIY